jgi:hypothetical protein
VTFTESWPARSFRTHGPEEGTLHHSWRFEVKKGRSAGRPGRVVRPPWSVAQRPFPSVGGEGAFPPQAAG